MKIPNVLFRRTFREGKKDSACGQENDEYEY